MNDEIYEKYKIAGKIAGESRDYAKTLVVPGVSYLEVAEKVESRIIESGAGLAFPMNIAVNEITAHYSPKHDDNLAFKKGDVVKLDIGAHVDGYIADTAVTVEVETDKYRKMIEASSRALDGAIDLMRAGIELSEIGKVVEETISSYGYKPIDNLAGHSMQRYLLHAGMSVPNVPDKLYGNKPKIGDVLAIEPFASNGAGHVIAGAGSNIYICKDSLNFRIIRDKKSKIIFDKINKEFKTLPFAERWFEKLIPNNNINLKKLSFLGLIKQYPQLIDHKKGIVTQKEHTVILTEEGCEVIT